MRSAPYRIPILLFLLILLACEGGPPPTTSLAPVGSSGVVDPDRLYFKNLRSSRYQTLDDHTEHRTTYLHNGLAEAPTGWQIAFTDDWLRDRAWLFLPGNPQGIYYRLGAEGEEIPLFEARQIGDAVRVVEFANRLAAPYEVCFRPSDATVSDCLPAQSPIRRAIRESIRDYLQLTDQDG